MTFTAPRRLSRKSAVAKGRKLELLARDYFSSLGALVETAPKVVVWIPVEPRVETPSSEDDDAPMVDPDMPQERRAMRPLSRRHDFFGVWDMILAWPDGSRSFAQVTVLSLVSVKRQAIAASGFPVTVTDCILGHEKGRTFRILHGPDFAMTNDRVVAPKREKKEERTT